MTFYRIEVPAYFSSRINAERPANTFHVNGMAAMEKHVASIAKQGCTEFVVTELTAAEYRAAAMAALAR